MNRLSLQVSVGLLLVGLHFSSTAQAAEVTAFEWEALAQIVLEEGADTTFDSPDGFSVATTRWTAAVEFDEEYALRIEYAVDRTPSLLDAVLRWHARSDFSVDLGQFKAPFSRERLTSPASIDFVNRAAFVEALAPGRQIGVQGTWSPTDSAVRVLAGLFNGNGANRTNDDGRYLFVARLELDGSRGDDRGTWSAGLNVLTGEDANTDLGTVGVGFDGSRRGIGLDLRAQRDEWFAAAEWIYLDLEPDAGGDPSPYGVQATVGNAVREDLQLLIRYEEFETDNLTVDTRRWTLGANWFPSEHTEIQANLLADPGLDERQLLLNFQIQI